jgi:hypothetical protein
LFTQMAMLTLREHFFIKCSVTSPNKKISTFVHFKLLLKI